MRALTALVDWKRALMLLPLLAAAALALLVLLRRDADSTTPRATLLDTSAVNGVEPGIDRGDVARDFSTFSPDGEPVRLSDLRGRPTVINFWATWCTSCLAEMPDLRDLQAEIGADRLNVLAVNAGEGSDAAKGFLEWLDAPDFHVGMDPTLAVADAYGVRGMPRSMFIDSAGIIRATYVGQLNEELMREYILAASSGTDGGDPPRDLRFVTTVRRERRLEVRTLDDERVEFRSKSLRCDDSYCAAPALDALADANGVLALDRRLEADPPTVTVTFDARRTSVQALTDFLAAEIRAQDDPLYTRSLQVEYR